MSPVARVGAGLWDDPQVGDTCFTAGGRPWSVRSVGSVTENGEASLAVAFVTDHDEHSLTTWSAAKWARKCSRVVHDGGSYERAPARVGSGA